MEEQKQQLRILFIHGGGYGVGRDLTQQPFAEYLRLHFPNFHMEHMTDTSNWQACLQQQADAIRKFRPDIVIGKSQGGPTILQLIHQQCWKGPSILCCPALVPGIDNFQLPPHIPVIVVVGSEDRAVPVRIGEKFLEVNVQYKQNIKLYTVHAGHGLKCLCEENEPITLTTLINEVWAMRLKVEGFDPAQSIPDAKLITAVPHALLSSPSSASSSSSSSSAASVKSFTSAKQSSGCTIL